MENNIEFVLSKRGLPCLWEVGGATSNKGSAIIIASSTGEPKEALCLGWHSNGCHALIPIEIGDHIVCGYQFHREFSFQIYKIIAIEGDKGTLQEVNSFDRGEWDVDLDNNLVAAVRAAKEKCTSYHCRGAFFCKYVDRIFS